MTKRSLLTRLYIVVLLAVPLFWLILTDEGRRYTDLAILKVKGGETMDIQLKALHSAISEQGLQQQLPDTPFSCGLQATPFGDRLCQVQLASFNGLPSRFAIAYFAGGQLQAMKIGYQRLYHSQLLHHLFATLGTPGREDHLTAPGAPGLYRWTVGDGELVALDESSLEGNEPSILWKKRQ
jgi:hypothetical protein